MTSMFRTTALAAALAAASFGAAAGPVQVDLDLSGLGNDAMTADAPVGVTNLQGFAFKNAFAYRATLPGGVGSTVPNGTTGDFLLSVDRTSPFEDLEIKLGSGFVGDGQFFRSLNTSIFSPATITISWFSGTTQQGFSQLSPLTSGLGWQSWAPGTPWTAAQAIDRIVFSAGASS